MVTWKHIHSTAENRMPTSARKSFLTPSPCPSKYNRLTTSPLPSSRSSNQHETQLPGYNSLHRGCLQTCNKDLLWWGVQHAQPVWFVHDQAGRLLHVTTTFWRCHRCNVATFSNARLVTSKPIEPFRVFLRNISWNVCCWVYKAEE